MESLPPELHIKIMGYATFKNDKRAMLSLAQTSHYLRTLFYSDLYDTVSAVIRTRAQLDALRGQLDVWQITTSRGLHSLYLNLEPVVGSDQPLKLADWIPPLLELVSSTIESLAIILPTDLLYTDSDLFGSKPFPRLRSMTLHVTSSFGLPIPSSSHPSHFPVLTNLSLVLTLEDSGLHDRVGASFPWTAFPSLVSLHLYRHPMTRREDIPPKEIRQRNYITSIRQDIVNPGLNLAPFPCNQLERIVIEGIEPASLSYSQPHHTEASRAQKERAEALITARMWNLMVRQGKLSVTWNGSHTRQVWETKAAWIEGI